MESDARAASSKKKAKSGGADDHGNGNATAVLDQPENERPEIDISLPVPQRPQHNDFALPAGVALPPTTAPDTVVTVATAPFALDSARSSPATVPAASSNGTPPPTVTAPKGTAVAAPSPPSSADPIAEAPMAIWYVMPPAGGRFGPARGDVMRKWLGEGRVTSDSLVWREGWADWLPAAKVFADLGSKSTPSAAPAISESPRRPIRPVRKASTSQGIAIVVTLGVVCVGLFAALLYVLMSNGGTVAPTP
jgi:hypothetical protein